MVAVGNVALGGGCSTCAGRNTGFRCYSECPLCYWKDRTGVRRGGGGEGGRKGRNCGPCCVFQMSVFKP